MMEQGDEAKTKDAAERFVELMRENELFAQKVLDVQNTGRVLLGRWNIPFGNYS